ncbi:MAG: hypothetical protein HQK65_04915 [Desulfamplus sp.]|nr:hypothetical protein [Desulfamplus sp.]
MAVIKFNYDRDSKETKNLLGADDQDAWKRFDILKECAKQKCLQNKKKYKKAFEEIANKFKVDLNFVHNTIDIPDKQTGEISGLKALKSTQSNLPGKGNDKAIKNEAAVIENDQKENESVVNGKESKSKKLNTTQKPPVDLPKNDIFEEIKSLQQDSNNLKEEIKSLNTRLDDINKISLQNTNKFKENIEKTLESKATTSNMEHLFKGIQQVLEDKASTNDVHNLDEKISILDDKIQKLNDNFSEYIIDKNFSANLNTIERNIETLEGKLYILDDINNSLKQTEKKPLSRSSVLASEGYFEEKEEADIIKLSQYCQRSLELLTISARHHFKNHAQASGLKTKSRDALESKHCQKENAEQHAADTGNKLIKKLIGNYADLDDLFASSVENDKVLVSFLKNQGLNKGEGLSKGESVKITEENKKDFELKADFKEEGNYTVINSCFELNDEIIKKATLELKKE